MIDRSTCPLPLRSFVPVGEGSEACEHHSLNYSSAHLLFTLCPADHSLANSTLLHQSNTPSPTQHSSVHYFCSLTEPIHSLHNNINNKTSTSIQTANHSATAAMRSFLVSRPRNVVVESVSNCHPDPNHRLDRTRRGGSSCSSRSPCCPRKSPHRPI